MLLSSHCQEIVPRRECFLVKILYLTAIAIHKLAATASVHMTLGQGHVCLFPVLHFLQNKSRGTYLLLDVPCNLRCMFLQYLSHSPTMFLPVSTFTTWAYSESDDRSNLTLIDVAQQTGLQPVYHLLLISLSYLKINSSNSATACKFSEFDVVWAKLDGYPWWPSLVCKHPTAQIFYKGVKRPEVHVQFFDETSSRAWLSARYSN